MRTNVLQQTHFKTMQLTSPPPSSPLSTMSPTEPVHSSGSSIRRIPITNAPDRPHATYHLHFTASGGIQSVPAVMPDAEGSRNRLVRSLSRRFARTKRRVDKEKPKGVSHQASSSPGGTAVSEQATASTAQDETPTPEAKPQRPPSPDLTETLKQRRERAAENAIQRLLEADRAQREQAMQRMQHVRTRSETLSLAALSSATYTADAPPVPIMPAVAGPSRSASAGPSFITESITPPPRSHSITPRAPSPQPPPRSHSAAAGVFQQTWPHAESSASGALSVDGHGYNPRARRETSISPALSSATFETLPHPTPQRSFTAPVPLAFNASTFSSNSPQITSRSPPSSLRKKPVGPRSRSPAVPGSAFNVSCSSSVATPKKIERAASVSQISESYGCRQTLSPSENGHVGTPPSASRLRGRENGLSTPSRRHVTNPEYRQNMARTPTRSASLSVGLPARSASLPSVQSSPASVASASPRTRIRNLASVSEVEVEEAPVAKIITPAELISTSPVKMDSERAPVQTVVSPVEVVSAEPSPMPSPSPTVAELPTESSDYADSASDSGSGPHTPVDSHFTESMFGSPTSPTTPYASVQLARATTIRRATAAVFTRAVSEPSHMNKEAIDSVRTVRPADVRPIPSEWSAPTEDETTPIAPEEPRLTRLSPPPRPKLRITTTPGPRSLLPPPRRPSVATSKSAPDMTRLIPTDRRSKRDTFGITSQAESDSDAPVIVIEKEKADRSQRRRSRQRYRSGLQSVADGIEKERILERLSRRPSAKVKPWGYL